MEDFVGAQFYHPQFYYPHVLADGNWCIQIREKSLVFLTGTSHTHTHTHTHTTILRLCGICPGQPGWAGTRRNIHPLTLIVVINHPYLLSPSITIHGILRIQSTCSTVFFHNPSPSFLWSTSGISTCNTCDKGIEMSYFKDRDIKWTSGLMSGWRGFSEDCKELGGFVAVFRLYADSISVRMSSGRAAMKLESNCKKIHISNLAQSHSLHIYIHEHMLLSMCRSSAVSETSAKCYHKHHPPTTLSMF